MRNWCKQAAAAVVRGLVVVVAMLMWLSVAGGAAAQPVITDVDAYDYQGAEILQFGGGTYVTITGSGFTGATDVRFGGVPGNFLLSVVDDNTIQTMSPAGPFGTSVSVTVETPLGISAPSSTPLTYGNFHQTAVGSVTPATGPAAGGTTVTILGSEFTGATKVEFGSTLATNVVVVDNSTITATVPAGTGTVDIFVTPPHGDANCACGMGTDPAPTYTYIPAPVITDLWGHAYQGEELIQFNGSSSVTIIGSGFTGATAVHIGGVPSVLFLEVLDDTRIRTFAPSGTFGTSVSVTVTTPGGTSAPSTKVFKYSSFRQPSIGSVSPASGPAAGGTTVTITGSAFTGARAVKFGTTPATSYAVVDDTTLTAVAPAGAGTVDVLVSNVIGVANCACEWNGIPAPIFTYIPGPVVNKIVRNGGSTAGGDTVVLTGSDLTGATAVSFGATAAASFTIDSDTQITAVTPAGTGNVNVKVTTPGGTSGVGPGNLFYYGALAPVLTAVTPSAGPEAGGTSVTITGSGFSGASNVLFGTTPATSFTVGSDTEITAISPTGMGTVDIFVDAPCCTNAPNGSFTYIPPGPPADSVKAEQLQDQFSPIVARNSGRAITGAVAKGIATGFGGGGPTADVGLGAESAFLAYAPEAAVTTAFDGFDGPGFLDPAEQWSLWLDIQGSGLLSGGSGQQLNLTGGIGYRFTDDFIAGIIGGQESFRYSTDRDGLLSGSGLSAGGYVAWRFAEHGMLDAALVGTALGYEVTAGTATGQFDASRWLVSSGLTGDFELGENLTVSPSARVTALWESQEGWTDSLATPHAAKSFSDGTASGGVTFSGKWLLLEDMTLLPYFGLFADYRFDSAGGMTTSGLEGRVQAGVRLNVSAGAAISIGGELAGLFSEQRSWSLNAGVSGGF